MNTATRPVWVKQRVKNKLDIERLAEYIVSKTPPNSFENKTALFMNLVENNHNALQGWAWGWEYLTNKTWELLNKRDGELKCK